MILRSNINPYKIIAWDGAAVCCNCAFGLAMRNNFIADCPDISAIWPDCSAAGIMLYGNTIRNTGGGFYIEAGAMGTVLRWNTVSDSGGGIGFRDNVANVALENYIFHNHGGMNIGTCDEDDNPKANAMMYNWLIDNGSGTAYGPDRYKESAHIFDHNVYKFLDWPDVDLRTKTPAVSKIDKNIDVELTTGNWPGTNLKSQLLAHWTGAINTEKDGEYQFYLKYHLLNGARLFIDNKAVVWHGETHDPVSMTEKDGQVELKAGSHEITVEFFHSISDNLWKSCVLSWQPPGGAKAVVPENVLFHRETAAGALQAGLKAAFFDISGDSLPLAMGGSVILRYGDKQYKYLASLRAEMGQERHGRVVTEFDPTPLGLATFRVHGTKKSWEPAPMFSNPGLDRNDFLIPEPYFWKRGGFRGAVEYGWWGSPAGYGVQTCGDRSGFVRAFWTRYGYWGKDPFDDVTASRATGYKRGIAATAPQQDHMGSLQMGALAPDKPISAEGYGYWSPSLPTTDGAQIDISFWLRAKKVKAVKENGGIFVAIEFCDETGQNVSRQYVIGGGDGDKPVAADWTTGDYLFRPFAGMVTAPKGARWFKLGFGMRNSSGWAAFSDVDIKTRTGTPQQEVKKAPPIIAGRCTWTPCDLSTLLNRPLADEVAGDGKGGWTDQGPTMDLRNLHAGDYTFNDVAFRVPKGNACFIMKSKLRPSENLPDGGQVDLHGKADVLAFLHSGAWLATNVQHATYVIHYADGGKVEIPVIAGKNILDWALPGSRADDITYDPAMGLLLPAISVPSPQFVHVTVWMLLWKNPRPGTEISALEVKGANEGIPGLIAVSRGVAK